VEVEPKRGTESGTIKYVIETIVAVRMGRAQLSCAANERANRIAEPTTVAFAAVGTLPCKPKKQTEARQNRARMKVRRVAALSGRKAPQAQD